MATRTRRILASIAVIGALLGAAGTATAASASTPRELPATWYHG